MHSCAGYIELPFVSSDCPWRFPARRADSRHFAGILRASGLLRFAIALACLVSIVSPVAAGQPKPPNIPTEMAQANALATRATALADLANATAGNEVAPGALVGPVQAAAAEMHKTAAAMRHVASRLSAEAAYATATADDIALLVTAAKLAGQPIVALELKALEDKTRQLATKLSQAAARWQNAAKGWAAQANAWDAGAQALAESELPSTAPGRGAGTPSLNGGGRGGVGAKGKSVREIAVGGAVVALVAAIASGNSTPPVPVSP